MAFFGYGRRERRGSSYLGTIGVDIDSSSDLRLLVALSSLSRLRPNRGILPCVRPDAAESQNGRGRLIVSLPLEHSISYEMSTSPPDKEHGGTGTFHNCISSMSLKRRYRFQLDQPR